MTEPTHIQSAGRGPIAVVVAMQKELDLLLPLIEGRCDITSEEGNIYHTGSIDGKPVVATRCGIGKVNAALAADELIRRFSPEVVINSGVAGGTGHGASVLDIVVGDEIAYHDVWCGPGTEPGQAAGAPLRFRSDRRLVESEALKGNPRIKHGLICSGDIFVSRKEEVDRISAVFPDVKAVDMESAAIAHTCYKRGVPFFCLRVVSDTPGAADNIGQYENFWDDAPRSTFESLSALIAGFEA